MLVLEEVQRRALCVVVSAPSCALPPHASIPTAPAPQHRRRSSQPALPLPFAAPSVLSVSPPQRLSALEPPPISHPPMLGFALRHMLGWERIQDLEGRGQGHTGRRKRARFCRENGFGARAPARARDPGGRRRLASAATTRARCRRLPSEHEPPLSTKEATALLSLHIQSADELRIFLRSMYDDGIGSPLYMPSGCRLSPTEATPPRAQLVVDTGLGRADAGRHGSRRRRRKRSRPRPQLVHGLPARPVEGRVPARQRLGRREWVSAPKAISNHSPHPTPPKHTIYYILLPPSKRFLPL